MTAIMRMLYFVRYTAIFIKAMVIANYQVAKLVISPKLDVKPGFLAVPMRAKRDFEITALANSITLTPGTISIHIVEDRKTIVIHAMDVRPDPEVVRRTVTDTLESNLLLWTRSASDRDDLDAEDADNPNQDK